MVHALEHAFARAAIGMALVDIGGRFLRVYDALCRIADVEAARRAASASVSTSCKRLCCCTVGPSKRVATRVQGK
jgi:hypothetical protein